MNRQSTNRDFLGRGWRFPVCARNGRIDMAEYDEDVAEAIRIILLTNRGERWMRPEFGASLVDFMYEPVNTRTMEALRVRVTTALIDYEPRIDVLRVDVKADLSEASKVSIAMHYRVRATNTQANVVFPFYLQEGHPR